MSGWREEDDGARIVSCDFPPPFEQRWRIVSKTCDGYEISTVFMGQAAGPFGASTPVCYETLVSPPDGDSGVSMRYRTRAQALVGHEHEVAKYGGRKMPPKIMLSLRKEPARKEVEPDEPDLLDILLDS